MKLDTMILEFEKCVKTKNKNSKIGRTRLNVKTEIRGSL
jgi:hypothetical protein